MRCEWEHSVRRKTVRSGRVAYLVRERVAMGREELDLDFDADDGEPDLAVLMFPSHRQQKIKHDSWCFQNVPYPTSFFPPNLRMMMGMGRKEG